MVGDEEVCVPGLVRELKSVCYVWLRKRHSEGERERESLCRRKQVMLGPMRDWEGEGSLLTEYIFKEGLSWEWEGAVHLCV